MKRVLHLVDSVDYVENNCFQHQLLKAMRQVAQVETCALPALDRAFDFPGERPVICCLKQRTLHRELTNVAAKLGNTPVVIYDQDPWHAYMDDSPYKGVYQRAVKALNLKAIAVTTRQWAQRIKDDGLPGIFTSMWVLPEYCDVGASYDNRSIPVGFIGSIHSHRRRLFEQLEDIGVQVNVMGGNGLPYPDYLRALGNLRVFIHSEDSPIVIDGQEANLKDALWIKDVEAAARGCFTIRNRGEDPGSYYDGIETVRLYDDVKEIPGLLSDIERMDPVERQTTIERSVQFIRGANRWLETANKLILNSST